ncbi:MAG: hypothetical protein JNL41_04000 [Phenylobacterium sp.]|uniref:hypothetical protein n=1 Tax=Phenylobacterium sp. TaxID=1871053 RepID=UPI001A3DB9AB|nr:hypothetical protein [Phenylobacterium sp.]MBL8553417.1 hypothetical protein [Phenylobacterium sp.]
MRTTVLSLIVVAALGGALAAAPAADAQTKKTTAAKAPAKAKAKPRKPVEPPPPEYVPQDRMKTSDEVKRSGVEGAATTPLRDLGVQKTDIPEVLLAALTDPYARPPRNYGCNYLTALVKPLDDVLGPDIDLSPVGDENLVSRGRALGIAADVASSALIPFRGVVRKVSGAEAHDRLVQSAYVAGSVRRAYLKGLGEAKGCNPPATPSHERAGSEPAADKRRIPIPKYPTRTSDAQQTTDGTPPSDRQK